MRAGETQMICPACNAKNSYRWKIPRYVCEKCGHHLTRTEYQALVQNSYDVVLASPPEMPRHIYKEAKLIIFAPLWNSHDALEVVADFVDDTIEINGKRYDLESFIDTARKAQLYRADYHKARRTRR
jgi:Zn ribbon nucleic-acid-binding protein